MTTFIGVYNKAMNRFTSVNVAMIKSYYLVDGKVHISLEGYAIETDFDLDTFESLLMPENTEMWEHLAETNENESVTIIRYRD